MTALNAGLLAIAAQIAILADAVAVLCLIGCGFYYMMARGNPRGQGQAFAWLIDVAKGLALVLGATILTQMFLGNLKLG